MAVGGSSGRSSSPLGKKWMKREASAARDAFIGRGERWVGGGTRASAIVVVGEPVRWHPSSVPSGAVALPQAR
jgi:hypothetical protein